MPWLAALVALHSERTMTEPTGHVFRIAAALLLQSGPLMLVLFLVLPRVSSLWAVPMERNTAITGMSDTLSFGNVARLLRSGALAFRVSFAAERPHREEPYWRGVVLSRFDGTSWRQEPALAQYDRSVMHRAGENPAV